MTEKDLPEGAHYIDGVRSNLENPRTFTIPSEEAKLKLRLGDYAKVGVTLDKPCPMHAPQEPRWHGRLSTGDRFWVRVEEIVEPGKRFIGVIDNDLVCEAGHKFNYGSHIEFEGKHILSVDVPTEPLEQTMVRRIKRN